mgnify:CR=1 FL=1
MLRICTQPYSNVFRDFSDKMIFIDKSRYLHYGRGLSRSEYSTRFLFVFRTVCYPISPWGAADSPRNRKKLGFYRKTADFREIWIRTALPTANPRTNSGSRLSLDRVGDSFFSFLKGSRNTSRKPHCVVQQQTENPPRARGHLDRDATVPFKILLEISFLHSSVDQFFEKYFSNTGGVPKHKVFSTPETRSGSSLLAFCSTLLYTKPMSTGRSISKPRGQNSPSDWSKEKKQGFTEVVSFLLGPLAVYRGCYVLSGA